MDIKVLGMGCAKCNALTSNVKRAAADLGLAVEIGKVTDPGQIADSGVMMTPALMIDGAIKVSGRVATVAEIKDWLAAVGR